MICFKRLSLIKRKSFFVEKDVFRQYIGGDTNTHIEII